MVFSIQKYWLAVKMVFQFIRTTQQGRKNYNVFPRKTGSCTGDRAAGTVLESLFRQQTVFRFKGTLEINVKFITKESKPTDQKNELFLPPKIFPSHSLAHTLWRFEMHILFFPLLLWWERQLNPSNSISHILFFTRLSGFGVSSSTPDHHTTSCLTKSFLRGLRVIVPPLQHLAARGHWVPITTLGLLGNKRKLIFSLKKQWSETYCGMATIPERWAAGHHQEESS